MERTSTHQMIDNDQFRHLRDKQNMGNSQPAGIRLFSDEIADPSTINRSPPIRTTEKKQLVRSIPNNNNNICIINTADDITNNTNNTNNTIINDNNNTPINNNTTINNNTIMSRNNAEGIVVEFGFCPYCGVATDRISGCNFMDCAIGDRSAMPAEKITEPLCRGQWCFVCGLAKYPTLPGYEYLKTCIDNSHNSHAGSSYSPQ